MEKYTVGELLRFLLRKCWVVLLSILVFVALLTVPRMLKTDEGSAEFQYYGYCSQLVEFENHATYVDRNNGSTEEEAIRYVDYNGIWYRNVTLYPFVRELSDKYDMAQFAPEWADWGLSQQASWVSSAFSTAVVANTPKYEVSFIVNVTREADTQGYIEGHLEDLFQDFLRYAESTAKVYREDTTLSSTGDLTRQFEETQPEGESGGFSIKYLAVGGFLGIIFGVLLVGIWFLTSRKVVSKQMFRQAYEVDTITCGPKPAYDISCYMIRQAHQVGNAALALSTTMENGGAIVGQVLEELVQYGYRVGLANLTDRQVPLPDKVEAVSADVCARLRIPGHARELRELAANYDFLLVWTTVPSADAVSTEIMLQCSCTVFVEKVGQSAKLPLKTALEELGKADDRLSVCIAWK